jgi:hypothetical protein
MSEDVEGTGSAPGEAGSEGVAPSEGAAPSAGNEESRPSLTTQVRRRRADQGFFLRLRDAIQQNHKALERMGT